MSSTVIEMECGVQGIIETEHVEALERLVQGLTGCHRESFRVHEICLKSIPNLGLVSSKLLLLRDLEQPELTWTVRHVGAVGPTAECIVGKNALRLFDALGYKLDHELLRVGSTFRFYRGAHVTLTVSSISKLPKLHATDKSVPVTLGTQLVEVKAPASPENYAAVVSAVSSLCEYLAQLIHLSKPGVLTGVVPSAL